MCIPCMRKALPAALVLQKGFPVRANPSCRAPLLHQQYHFLATLPVLLKPRLTNLHTTKGSITSHNQSLFTEESIK